MMKRIFLSAIGIVAVAMAVSVMAPTAEAVTIPNSNFDTIYKPGSGSITADLDGGTYTYGAWPGASTIGTATYSDATTGSGVDVPGWTHNGGTGVGLQETQGGLTPDSALNAVYVNGPAYSGGSYSVVSAASLGNILANTDYTLSIRVGKRNDTTPGIADGHLFLSLLGNGSPLTPSSSSSPTVLAASWVTWSRTFTAASLTGSVGQAMTIQFGSVNADNLDTQTNFDTVVLTDVAVPEPTSFGMLLLGAVGVVRAARKRCV